MARIKHWLFQDLVRQFCEHDDTNLFRETFTWIDGVNDRTYEKFRCKGKTSRSNLVWVYSSSEIDHFVEITDGAHVLLALISSETQHEGNRDLDIEDLALELVEFDICVLPNPPDDCPSLGFYLVLTAIRAHSAKRPTAFNSVRPIWKKANILALQNRLRCYLQTAGPRAIPDDAIAASIHGSSRQQQFGVAPTGRQLRTLAVSNNQKRTTPAPGPPENPAEMASEGHSNATAATSELEQWSAVTSLKRLPKYGSTAADTSKEQTELLASDLAWDPPAPGKDRPTNYIPSKDFELLIDLADNPEKYAQLEQAAKSQKIAAQAIAMQENLSTFEGQASESTDNSIITHALQARARMGTPDATALGASQWPPSPQQVRQGSAQAQENKNGDSRFGEVQELQQEAASSSATKGGRDQMLEQSQKDVEDDESLPDVGDDRLPPDSEDNPSSPAPQETQVSPSSQLLNRTAATQSQNEPQHSIQVPDSNLKAMASLNATKQMPVNSSTNQQQSSKNEGLSGKTRNRGSAVTGDVSEQKFDSVPATQTRPFPVLLANDAESDADSELEEQAPQGTNDILSSPIAPKSQAPFKQPTVQVGRSPQSQDKRSLAQPRKASRPQHEQDQRRRTDTTRKSGKTDDVLEISSSKEASTSSYSFTKHSLSSRVHSSGSRNQLSARKPAEALTPGNHNDGKKRKRAESDQQAGPSERGSKSYRVRPASPEFSQNMLDMADSTPAVDRARREHFKWNESSKLQPSLSQADVMRRPSSKEPSEHDPLTQSSKSKTSTVVGSTKGSGSLPLSQPSQNRQNKEPPSPSARDERQNEDLLSNFEADVLEEQTMLREKNAVSTTARHKSRRLNERPITKVVARHSSKFVPNATSSLTPDDQYSSDDSGSKGIDLTARHSAGRESDEDMQVDEVEPTEHFAIPVRRSADADLMDVDGTNSGSRLHPKIRKLMEANSRRSHNASPAPTAGLFAKFKATYPKYCGDEKQFIAVCKKLVRPKKQGIAIMKLFFDDFVGRYPTEYKLYSIHRIDEGETPDPYEQWFNDNVEAASFKKRILNEAAVSMYLADAQSVQSVTNNDSLLVLRHNDSSNDYFEANRHKATTEAFGAESSRQHTHERSSIDRRSIDAGQVGGSSRAASSDFRAPPAAKLSVAKARKRSISPPPQPVAKSRSTSRVVSTPVSATMPPPRSNRPLRESSNAAQKARRATTGPQSPMVLVPACYHGNQAEEDTNMLASDPIDLTGQDSSPPISSSDDDEEDDPTFEEIPRLKPRPAPSTLSAAAAKKPANDASSGTSGTLQRPSQADHSHDAEKKRSRRSLPWQLESGDNGGYEEDSTPTRVASAATNTRTVAGAAPRQHRRATIAPDGETIKSLRASKPMTFTPRPGTSKAVAERLRKRFMEAQAAAAAAAAALSGDQAISSSNGADRPVEIAARATKPLPSASSPLTAPAARTVPEKAHMRMIEEVDVAQATPVHEKRRNAAETSSRKSSASASASAGRERPYRRMLEEADVESEEPVQSSGRNKGKRTERG